MIPTGVRDFSGYNGTSVQTLELDNCFEPQVESDKISTILTRAAAESENHVVVELWQDRNAFPYVQIYTPPHKKSIAIEPVSANINDFNSPHPKKITVDQPFRGSYGIRLSN
jgi:aldose 1-epimerase